MNAKTFRLLTALLAFALAVVASWAVITGNYAAVLIGVVLALGLSYILRRFVKEVIQDERSTAINEKAWAAAVRCCLPVAGIVSVVLLALKDRLSPDVTLVAYTLAYATCVLMLAHLAFYSYYSRKH